MNYKDSNLRFVRAGADRYLLFLNRTISTWQEDDVVVSGYHYDEVIVEASDSNRETLISALIHTKYSVDREIALLRQRDSKQEEFVEYNSFAESCKLQIDEMFNRK